MVKGNHRYTTATTNNNNEIGSSAQGGIVSSSSAALDIGATASATSPLNTTSPNDLLQFRFATAPPIQNRTRSGSYSNNNYNNNHQHNNNNKNRKDQQYKKNQQNWTSARRRSASSMFYLHSSSEHSFIITRRGFHLQEYSFNGCDEPVSWESVKLVKHLLPLSPSLVMSKKQRQQQQQSTTTSAIMNQLLFNCPVCLDPIICARITKCGHSFCLPCIIRHVQSYSECNPNKPVKCPCCAVPIHLQDLRPVILESCTQPIQVKQSIKLHKLHRTKNCSAPYLPLPDAPKRSSVHAAPCITDCDSKYTRFNYIDYSIYQKHLKEDSKQLQDVLSHSSPDHVEIIFLNLSMSMIKKDQQKAIEEEIQEQSFIERFHNTSSGIYQVQPKTLFASNYQDLLKNNSIDNDNNDNNHNTGVEVGSVPKDSFLENAMQHVSVNSNPACASANAYGTGTEEGGGTDAALTTGKPEPGTAGAAMTQQQRYRGDSIGSEISNENMAMRYRGNSIGSEYSHDNNNNSHTGIPSMHHPASPNQNQQQQYSSPAAPSSPSTPRAKKEYKFPPSSIYLDENACHFYQSIDGQLCFLSGFNMNCLLSDYASYVPNTELLLSSGDNNNNNISKWERRKMITPLPDYIEGNILEIENVHLTQEIRKRMPFLAHLPLHIDITFVELDINRLLSYQTKNKFKNDFEKRKKRRMKKINDEKRADRIAQQKEQQRIDELKARIQRIDPNDDFFHISPPQEEALLSGDSFGPALGTSPHSADINNSNNEAHAGATNSQQSTAATTITATARPNATNTISFSKVAKSGGVYGAKVSAADLNFPALGSTSPKQKQQHPRNSNSAPTGQGSGVWGSKSKGGANPTTNNNNSAASWGSARGIGGVRPITNNMPVHANYSNTKVASTNLSTLSGAPGSQPQASNNNSKKKGKGKKVMLFSTGAHRGSAY